MTIPTQNQLFSQSRGTKLTFPTNAKEIGCIKYRNSSRPRESGSGGGSARRPLHGMGMHAPYITVLAVRLAVCIYNAPTGRPFIGDLYYGRKFTCVVVNLIFTPSGLHDLKHLVRHRIMRQCDMGHIVVRGYG